MKFLRGKIWQIILAICMLAVLLCITASAADPVEATVTFGTTPYTFNEESSTWQYLKTDNSGVITAGTDADYNIALVVEDNLPVMRLNGATIIDATTGVEISTSASQFVIVTETASSITQTPYTSEDNSEKAAIRFASELVFRGSAKLTVTGANSAIMATAANSELLFENAVVDVVTTAGRWGGAVFARSNTNSGSIKNIDVVGGTVFAQAKTYMLMYCGTTTVTVDGGGHLTLQADSSTINWNKATYHVKNGYLYTVAKSSLFNDTASTVQVDENGVWEAKNTASAAVLKNTPQLFEGYYAVHGTAKDTATAYNVTTDGNLTKQYFKVGKPATVTVTDGTAQAFGVSGATITAMVDDTVTLTAPDGLGFNGWSVTEGPDGFTDANLADAATSPTTFTMPDGDVSVKANVVYAADVLLRGSTYTITDSPAYYTTDANGDIIAATADTYTIKLVYNGNIPTVYLKNANLSYVDSVIENGTGTTIFAIETEAASTLNQTGNDSSSDGVKETRGAVKTSGKVIFRGDALLTMTGAANGIYGSNSAEVLFEGSNVALSRAGSYSEWYDGAFYGSFKSITFDGGTAVIRAPRLFMQTTAPFYIRGGANVSMINGYHGWINYSANTITVEDGYLYLESTGANVMLNNGTVKVLENGVFEAYNKNASGTISAKAPNLTEFTGYYAVAGTSKATATVYDGTSVLSNQYFAVGKKVTVSVTDGTAQAFADSSTEITAIAGVDVTLTANEAPEGKEFLKWTADTDVTFANVNATPTTFKPAGDVTVTANFGKKASVTIAGTARTVYQGYDAMYFTTSGGTVAVGGTEDTYNIKFVYPEGENAVPTLYLRGAYLTQSIASDANTVAGTTIVVEKVGNYPSTVPEGIEADSYMTATINWGYDLTVKGYEGNEENPALENLGKLKMNTGAARLFTMNAAYMLTLKDLNLEGTATSYSIPASITFDGGKASVVSDAAPYVIWASQASPDTVSQGITVTGGADATISGAGNTICLYYATSAKIIVNEDSKLKVVSSNSQAIRAPESQSSENVLQVIGGTLEVSGTAAGYSGTVARISGYDDTYFVTINSGTTSDADINLNNYSYVKIEPAHTISVTDGTASVATDRVTVSNATKAPAGATVTLTPTTKTGYRFYQWTFGNDSQEPTITENVFTMPAGAVSVVANYDEVKTIKILGVDREFTVREPLYFTTDGGVTPLTEGDLENLYNIKLALVDGVPTVYLKGATVTSTASGVRIIENGTDVSAFTIVTESDSVLDSYSNAIYVNRADLTLAGTGKLSLIGNNNPNATTAYGGAATICIYHYATTDAEESKVVRTITLDENANVYIKSNTFGTSGTGGIWSEPNINANVIAKNGCSLEVESDTNIFYAGINLTFQGYTDWAGVIGDSKETATGYNGGANPARGSKYFKIAPGYTVTVDSGTASGVSSNGGRFLPGTTVTLSPGAAETGKAFWKWTTEDEIDIASNQFTMIAEDVSVEAVWQNKATVYFKDGTPYSVLEYTPNYLKSVADSAPTAGTEADHDIELKYTDGIPAVHLKGAALSSTTNTYCLTNGTDITDLLIVVEEDSTITSYGRGIYMQAANLTIQGPGKLTITSNTGGKVQYGGSSAIQVVAGNGNTITFDTTADVEIYTDSVELDSGLLAYSACIWIESGSVPVTIENGAKLQMSSPNRVSYSSSVITIANDYTDAVAVYGADLATGSLFTSGAIVNSQQFFKIAPGYDVTVENGTTNVARAFAGMNVTVTPAAAADGEGFKYWTSAVLLGEGVNYNSSYTFTMPNEPVTVAANYGDLAQVILKGTTTYDFVQDGATRYFTVVDNVITEVAEGQAYNIMMSYAAGGKPTLTLNDLTLTSGNYGVGYIESGVYTPELVIVVKGTNTVGGTLWSAIEFNGNNLTITGDGTLNLLSNYKGIHLDQTVLDGSINGSLLTIDGVTINITATKDYQGCINAGTGSVLVDGGRLVLTGAPKTDSTVGASAFSGSGELTVDGDAYIEIPTASTAIGLPLVLNSGTIIIGSEDNYANVTTGTSHVMTFNGGFLEIFADVICSNYSLPVFTYDCVATEAPTKAAFMANPNAYIYEGANNYLFEDYFRVEPKHVEVTITWGAMTFNYNGSIWDTENLTWVGNWEPTGAGKTQDNMRWDATNQQWVSTRTTDAESTELAANQIKVENTGTDTVDVEFTFATAGDFITDYGTNIIGTFTDGEGATITTITLIRFQEADAYLNLSSAAVASDFGSTTLGTVTVVIDALTPAQGGNA
ncbi:MAG: hypothetical protein IJA74_01385 [Oscillospiraceae bacterium]|nr:hypothetical protein [Oscillospiraceae bacterium]